MKKEEYIEKKVVLYGYGPLKEVALDANFFSDAEEEHGGIKAVLEITKGFGGLGPLFSLSTLNQGGKSCRMTALIS